MRSSVHSMSAAVALMLCTGSAPALADTPTDDETAMTATVTSPGYPVLTRGQVVVVHAQRLVLTQEPPPAARVGEAPP
ncbi:MAG: hypothetical protein WBM46_12585, partial [Polyangiales bacterium]